MPEEKTSGARQTGKTAIIQVNPAIAENNLFRGLAKQIVEDEKVSEILSKLIELKSGPEQIAAIVHTLMRQTTGTLLGYIIPPENGSKIIKDRIVQNAVTLLEILREEVLKTEREIEQALRENNEYEIEEKVRELVEKHHVAMLAISEIMNRYLTLYAINLPPEYRPPLAKIKLGIEVIKVGE